MWRVVLARNKKGRPWHAKLTYSPHFGNARECSKAGSFKLLDLEKQLAHDPPVGTCCAT